MAGELPLFGPALQLLALVVQLLRFSERDRDLGDAVLEVQLERDDGEALAARATDQLADLVCVEEDRKSTRLNSSHITISYAVFCLKKKKNKKQDSTHIILHHNTI